MRALLSSLAAAGLALAGCSYDFTNPAENLGAGEVAGRVVADVAGDGVLVVVPGVEVRVRNSANVQTTRESGRFFLMGLLPGRHTLLLSNGTGWALQRDVDVAAGADGSLEGVVLGDLRIRRSVTLGGTLSPPTGAGADAPRGAAPVRRSSSLVGVGPVIDPFPTVPPVAVVVDEATGLQVDATAEWNATAGYSGRFTYAFPGSPVGAHRIRFALSAEVAGVWTTWVGGPLTQEIPDSSEGRSLTLSPAQGRIPDTVTTGKLRFRVVAAPGVPSYRVFVSHAATGVTVGDGTAGNPYPVPDSGGWVEVDVVEGLYSVVLDLGASPGSFQAPPSLQAVVIADQTTDLGALSIVDSLVVNEAMYSCLYDTDCQAMYACSAGTCTFQEPHVTTPACVTGPLVESQCFDWQYACFMSFATTPCDGGKGTCAAGPGSPVCVPNGTGLCTVGAEFYSTPTCGSSVPACVTDANTSTDCPIWSSNCSVGSTTLCAGGAGICAPGPVDFVCVPNGYTSCTEASQTWNAPVCTPSVPACVTDANTMTDCSNWSSTCALGSTTLCAGGTGICAPGPVDPVCVPNGYGSCTESSATWGAPACTPAFPPCIRDAQTDADCAGWSLACFGGPPYAMTPCNVATGGGYCTNGPGYPVCVPTGYTTCLETAQPFSLPPSCP